MAAAPFLWIAHRGDHRQHAENSLGAFAAAWDAGFGAVELDLQQLGDGTVVVCHDPTTARLGHHAGPARTLADLDLPTFRRLLPHAPTFDEFADTFAGRSWLVNLEVKGRTAILRAIDDWRVRFAAPLISSFRPGVVAAAAAAGWPVAYLFDTRPDWDANAHRIPAGARLHLNVALLDGVAHEALPAAWAASELYVYTVNEPGQADRLRHVHPNLRGAFTDDAALAGLG